MLLTRLLLDPTMVRRPLLEPNLSLGGLTFISCVVRQGKPREAKKHFESAVKLDPGLYEAHLNLGKQLALEGDYARGEMHFRKAAESPDPLLRQAAEDSLKKLAEERGK